MSFKVKNPYQTFVKQFFVDKKIYYNTIKTYFTPKIFQALAMRHIVDKQDYTMPE